MIKVLAGILLLLQICLIGISAQEIVSGDPGLIGIHAGIIVANFLFALINLKTLSE